MKPPARFFCEVCGARQGNDDWFLVVEDLGQDTLQILRWNTRLAEQAGMRHLCSPAHVEKLVSHWMMTGSLDYEWSRHEDPGDNSRAAISSDVDGAFRLGELRLDRASFAALGERPDMLSSILDAIDGALQAVDNKHSALEDEEPEEDEEAAVIYDA